MAACCHEFFAFGISFAETQGKMPAKMLEATGNDGGALIETGETFAVSPEQERV